MQPVVLVDLDGTIYTEGTNEGTPIATNSAGDFVCFMNEMETDFLSWILNHAIVVPCTARGLNAFRLFNICFEDRIICSNGATIIDSSGKIDEDWQRLLADDVASIQKDLQRLFVGAVVTSQQQCIGTNVDIISDDGKNGLFIKIEQKDRSGADMIGIYAEALKHIVPRHWRYVIGPYRLKVFPPFISKERAALWYLNKYVPGAPFVIGMGDSFNDVGFMGICDYLLTPRQSELAALLRMRAQKEVTAASMYRHSGAKVVTLALRGRSGNNGE